MIGLRDTAVASYTYVRAVHNLIPVRYLFDDGAPPFCDIESLESLMTAVLLS